MSFSTTYIGAGTTLSSSYYLRTFYSANRNASSSSSRSDYSTNELSLADGLALQRAIKKLGSFSYSDDDDTNIRNSVSAFISTYNNMMSSLSGSDDSTLSRSMKQMKSITSEYASELDDVGITVNSDGTLTGRESLLSSADLSKFKSLFSSDSKYMQRINAYRKRVERQSDALVTKANIDKIAAHKAAKNTKAAETSAADATALSGDAALSSAVASALNSGNVNIVV